MSAPEPSPPLLSVRDLSVELPTRHGRFLPVDAVSFSLSEGDIVGLVGESGAGKSLIAGSITNLLDSPARIAAGEIRFEGRRIDDLPSADLRALRGSRIALITQNPMGAFDPLATIGSALVRTLQAHTALSDAEARSRACSLLAEVELSEPERRMRQYPHELSGGMLQRVVIATAIAHDPKLIIADEPTSALDVSTQLQIVRLLCERAREKRVAILLISHNIALVAKICSRILVLYAGRVVEAGPTAQIISAPSHPYTRGLIGSVPRIGSAQATLASIRGTAPHLDSIPAGCAFHPRCDFRFAPCDRLRPPLLDSPQGRAACWLLAPDRA